MKVYLHKIKDNRFGWGSTRGSETDIEMDLPENHDFLKYPLFYQLVNGQLIKDGEYEQQFSQELEEKKNKPSTDKQLEMIQKVLDDIVLGVI